MKTSELAERLIARKDRDAARSAKRERTLGCYDRGERKNAWLIRHGYRKNRGRAGFNAARAGRMWMN